jgi:spermidine synthase
MLIVLVAVSGAASLVYQVVWMRRLALVFGSTTLATSTVLVAFLGGLALGAWIWGLAADRRPRAALGLFGLVEAGIGLYALVSPWAFGAVEAVYLAAAGPMAHRPSLFVGLQFAMCALVIAPPAMFMGGSVPLLARRLVTAPDEGTPGIGLLYGWNTLGASVGAGLAAYGLLPALGLSGAVLLAASANLLVAAVALLLDARDRSRGVRAVAEPAAGGGVREEPGPDPVTVFVLLQAFGLSGFAVIMYEVAWARLLALTMGSSLYDFGTLVVIMLAGLGLGSAVYARARRSVPAHLAAFALLQCLIGLTAVASLLVAPQLPWLFMRFSPVFRDAFGWQIAAYVVLTALLAFPPALLSGATFPAVIGSLGGALARLGRTFGTAYGANTVGTVLGAFLAGFVFIPALGLRATIVIGVVANLLAGASVLLRTRLSWRKRLPSVLAAATSLALVVTLPPWPREVFAAGIGFFASRFASLEAIEQAIRDLRLLYYKDGINTTISVDQVGDHLVYRSNWKTDASTYPTDMSTQQLLGHLPMLRHPAPQDVFVLGLGTGVTAAAVARYPVQRIDIVELEPAGVEASRFFDRWNRSILNDPRVRLLLADGRNRLRAFADRYDIDLDSGVRRPHSAGTHARVALGLPPDR